MFHFRLKSDKKPDGTRISAVHEVYNILRGQYFVLKKDYEKQVSLKYSLNHKIISPLRAIAMAKNIFVHGDLKKLRTLLQQFKKDKEKFNKNLESYYQREKIFKSKNWTTDNYATFLQEKYKLTKQKTLLDLEKIRLDNLKLALDKQKATLDSICRQPQAVRQIQLIAAGILRKNQKFVVKVQDLNNHIQRISERIKHTKTQIDILELQLKLERHTTYYKVLEPKYSDKTAASLIADAILHEPHAVQLVARSSSNNLEMEKDWELMSDLEKDELLHKQIFRDL
jgi:hypothetical protein